MKSLQKPSSASKTNKLRYTKEGNGKPMMPALQLLRLAKRHIYGRSDVEQCKNLVCSPIHS